LLILLLSASITRFIVENHRSQLFLSSALISRHLSTVNLHLLSRLLLASWLFTTPSTAESPPNVVLVFIDDLGWADFSCFGNEGAETKNIDRLAKEGLRFEQFYVNSPICSPSRVAISTGQYPQRWRITSYLNNRKSNTQRGMAQWLDPKAPMIARALKERGYTTGHFGKWHMGGQRDVTDAPPITDYGFDVSLTNFEGMGPKLLPLILKPGDQKPGKIWQNAESLGEGYRWMLRSKITGGFVEAALPFINQAQKEDKPFYLNLWPDDVHSPYWPPVDQWADGKRGLYHSVLEEMDRQLGLLFDRIRNDEKLRDNTLIIVCSDNGPEVGAGSAGPYRGSKATLWEGGIRSPLIIWGPGLLSKEATGTTNSTALLSAIDLVASLHALLGTTLPEGTVLDGEAHPDTFLGKSKAGRRGPLFFRRPPDRKSHKGQTELPDLAVRHGDMKLLCNYDGSDPFLFLLHTDPGEEHNLAAQHPKLVQTLTTALLAWHKGMPEDAGSK
jgi:arylsulfatase A-like enzyme